MMHIITQQQVLFADNTLPGVDYEENFIGMSLVLLVSTINKIILIRSNHVICIFLYE